MSSKIDLLFITVFFAGGISKIQAEKIITIRIEGKLPGYFVSEQHLGELHTLSCVKGQNDPCKWTNDPNTITNNGGNDFNNPVPANSVFYDENGLVVVDVVAVNNAINVSLNSGNTSATIIVNNVTLTYTLAAVQGLPDTDELIVHLWAI